MENDMKIKAADDDPGQQIVIKNLFPNVTQKEWDDWRWQVRNRITTLKQLEQFVKPENDEIYDENGKLLPFSFSMTPHYANLIAKGNGVLRRAVIPTLHESVMSAGEEDDPLHEDKFRPVHNIIHRYPDKCLFLATDFCALRCRYCTRSRLVSECADKHFSTANLEEAINYIKKTPVIRDVLISGGDPLTLSDEKLEWILKSLREIPHVEIIRIGTKTPVVLPQRITTSLVNMLKKYHPLWINIHFMHPAEISNETKKACNMLADAGIPLGSQTVLLKGINDNSQTMMTMFNELIKIRVRPYYIYQCDNIPGSEQFRTPISTGLNIMRDLLGQTSGFAIPTFIVDTSGGGKVPLLPNYVKKIDKKHIYLEGFNKQITKYPIIEN